MAGTVGGKCWTVIYTLQAGLPVMSLHLLNRPVISALSRPQEIGGGEFGKGKM